ncbi:MAG: 3-hydroxyacyl-CoA dehydrogenase NAD-binding domain-containing protein [Betaproteobacteria bacterium]
MSQIDYHASGNLAVITLRNPPVNGLGFELRRSICDGVQQAIADPAIEAIVLTGAGKAFSGGADIREFNTPKAVAEPNLLSVIRLIESSPKPVIAAIHSVAMGGGLELAMGCHFRVASPGAQIALPEVKLGVLPGAGGTQRLPRLVGLEAGLNMIVSGQTVLSEKLAQTKLFDQIVEGDLVAGAKAFAKKVIEEGKGLPKVRDIKVRHPDAQALLQFARNTVTTVARNFPAPLKCVDAVAASVDKPFDEAMRQERAFFLELVQTPESRALRHAFFGERAASKIPDIPEDTPVRPIATAAVIGAGTMGGGIAMNFINAGVPVTLLEMNQEALDRGIGTIRKNYEATARKGRMTEAEVEQRMSLIRPALEYEAIAAADIVIEAVFEDMAVKETVFRKLDQVMKPGAILATNTSTLDVNRIADFTSRPQDVIGTHFFSPANVMKLLEIVRGAKTAKDVLATTMQLAKRLRKTGVVSGVCDGFIGNRMIEQYIRQAGFMLEEGALPQQVDKAIEKFGFAMGPFRMSDLAGNDVGWYIRKRRYIEHPELKYPRIADRVCELGRFGQKTGAGFYRYEKGRRDAIPDPVVEQLIVDHRAASGIKARKLSDDEIVHRLVFALVNEGAKILEEGIALRASDIDMIYLTGYGFPLHRGGPMLYADQCGLYNVAARMNEFARNPHGDPQFWVPAALLARLVEAGKGFNS